MVSAARVAALTGFLVIAVLALFACLDRSRAGTPSATLKPDGASSNTLFVVTAAPARGPLHVGDRIRIDDPGELAAFALHGLPVGGALSVVRTSPLPQTAFEIPVRSAPRTLFLVLLETSIQLLFIATAGFIALRGRSAGSLALAWFFALLTLLVNPVTPAWPKWLMIAYAIVDGTIGLLAFLCAIAFATSLSADDGARWPRRVRRVLRAIGLVAILINLGVSLDAAFAPSTPAALQYFASGLLFAAAVAFLATLAFAYARAPQIQRQRILWVVASLAIGIVGFVLTVAGQAAQIAEPLRDYPLLLLIAMPVGCAYAIVRYRLLDIAFAVNRATVFGVTSLVVLGALALVDSGLQTLLGSWLVRTGLYVQLGLALVIGIATRPIHERVDRAVDDVFFRRRHEAERTLRRFARDVAYIDDADTVIKRTTETVSQAAGLRCSIFISQADGSLTEVPVATGIPLDRNDAAVVRLRATREAVDLREIATALRGDYAFPMFARNRLLGILACGDKLDGIAAYAPDELEAVGAVAHATGLAIDLLRIEALERELTAVRASAALLTSGLRSLE